LVRQIRIWNNQILCILFDLISQDWINRVMNLINESTVNVLKIRLILVEGNAVCIIQSSFRILKFWIDLRKIYWFCIWSVQLLNWIIHFNCLLKNWALLCWLRLSLIWQYSFSRHAVYHYIFKYLLTVNFKIFI